MKIKTIWVRHDYDTAEPLATANSFEELQKKKSQWLHKKGKEECIYDKEYVEIEEGEVVCPREEWKPERYEFCPHCGKKLVYKDEDLCLNGGI